MHIGNIFIDETMTTASYSLICFTNQKMIRSKDDAMKTSQYVTLYLSTSVHAGKAKKKK